MSEIEILSTSKVNKIKACPASIGPGTKTPKSQLDRWVAVFNAISGILIVSPAPLTNAE